MFGSEGKLEPVHSVALLAAVAQGEVCSGAATAQPHFLGRKMSAEEARLAKTRHDEGSTAIQMAFRLDKSCLIRLLVKQACQQKQGRAKKADGKHKLREKFEHVKARRALARKYHKHSARWRSSHLRAIIDEQSLKSSKVHLNAGGRKRAAQRYGACRAPGKGLGQEDTKPKKTLQNNTNARNDSPLVSPLLSLLFLFAFDLSPCLRPLMFPNIKLLPVAKPDSFVRA